MKSLPILLALALVPLAHPGAYAAADDGEEPQDAWMLHVDGRAGSLRFVPDRIVLVPGGTVQLMVFGQGHGRYSVTLVDAPGYEAEVDTATPGVVVHVAEFAAPTTPGEYAFHDKHHPEATGVLVVRPARAQAADAQPTVGVGNGYDTKFYPARLEVPAGAEIRFMNNASEIIHTMTAADGAFDADAVRPGEERTFHAPTELGEHPFMCKYHESTGMRGVLVVVAAASGSPAPTAAATPTASTAAGPTPGGPEEAAESPRDAPAAPVVILLGIVTLAALAARSRRRIR